MTGQSRLHARRAAADLPADTSTAANQGLPRQIKAIALVAFIVALGFGVVGPAIPLLAKDFGVGKAVASSAISAFALCRLASAFVNGRLVERVGEQRMLAVGLAMQAVTTVLSGASPNFVLVIFFRSIGGFGSAAFTVAAMSLLLRLAPESHRGRAASLYQGGFLLGAIAGPAAGGFLAEISPRVPFFVYGVFLAIAGAVGMVMLRERPSDRTVDPVASGRIPSPHHLGAASDNPLLVEHTDEGVVGLAVVSEALEETDLTDDGQQRISLRQALRSRAYVTCLVVNLGVGWMLYGVRNSLMPVYVVEVLHKTPIWAGSAFLIGSLAQALVLWRAGRLVDARGRKPIMIVGGIMGTGSVAALTLPPGIVMFLLSMVVFGGAGALLASAPAAVLADVTKGRGGRVVAVFQMAADVGGVTGPVVAGILTDVLSYQAAFAVGACVLGFGLLFALVMPETGVGKRSSA